MRIDEINAMADADIRENEQVEKLAEINYPMCEWAEEQCLVRRLAYINGYNQAKENYKVESSLRELHQYKLGLQDGYNKAKETLYTEESDDHSVDANKMASSIDWLAEQQSQLFNQVKNGQIQIDEYEYYFELIIKQAKAMHKKEIIRAAADHCYPTCELAMIDAEEYYKVTFKSE